MTQTVVICPLGISLNGVRYDVPLTHRVSDVPKSNSREAYYPEVDDVDHGVMFCCVHRIVPQTEEEEGEEEQEGGEERHCFLGE